MRVLAAVLLASGAMLWTSTALAFGQDICYVAGSGEVQSCGPLPPQCLPAGTANAVCKAAMMGVVAEGSARFVSGRSSIHTDVTSLLAQAMGFSATDAYWIAAYDQAVDQGTFELYDDHSMPMGAAYSTINLNGMTRGDFPSGGALLHFVVPYNGGSNIPPRTNGLAPDPTDTRTEVTLASYRAWALAGSGDAHPACTAGITEPSLRGDIATGSQCAAAAAPIKGSQAVIGTFAFFFTSLTGSQMIQDPEFTRAGDPGSPVPVYATDFDTLVGTDGAKDTSATHVADARLGIYLHILGDRISHHNCTDHSVLAGPQSGRYTGYTVRMVAPSCEQIMHILGHAWETGIRFDRLPPERQTTVAGLSAIYDELLYFAASRGVLKPQARAPERKQMLITRLTQVLQSYEASARVSGIAEIACQIGVEPFIGSPSCQAGSSAYPVAPLTP